MQFIEEDCYVNTKEIIEYPPVALSYGEKLLKTKSGDSLITNSVRNLWKFKLC